jgi:hypothetical protein
MIIYYDYYFPQLLHINRVHARENIKMYSNAIGFRLEYIYIYIYVSGGIFISILIMSHLITEICYSIKINLNFVTEQTVFFSFMTAESYFFISLLKHKIAVLATLKLPSGGKIRPF